ncbi:MAG: leucine-rich repeat domain-containing protein [Gottschalkiaceae bacterium]|nr:MAG: leucine-rich repeat domain-containing protein [Gottschalkiaceae bacterium]
MRKILAILLMVTLVGSLMAGCVESDVVHIVDNNLEIEIREILGKPTGDITKKDMEVLVVLDIKGKDIYSLEGLEHAVNLFYLGIVNKDSSLSDLRPISKLTKLTDLIIENAEISDVRPIKDLTNLTLLSLKNNNISDISPLKNLINLDLIDIEYNDVRDISTFSEFTQLRYAYIEGNNISDISSLSGLTELKRLRATNNIKDLSMLENLDNLVDLELVQ